MNIEYIDHFLDYFVEICLFVSKAPVQTSNAF